MIGFLLSPALSFFSKRLYREALQSGFGKGFRYLGYLCFLFLILTFFLCNLLFLPFVRDFTNWLTFMTPEMTMTADGLQTNDQQEYFVKHPAFGPLYLIDTSKDAVQLLSDDRGAVFLIGRDQVIMKNVGGGSVDEARAFSFSDMRAQLLQSRRSFRITKQVMRQMFDRLEGMVTPFVVSILVPIFFIWKLGVALLWSLVALGLNQIRKDKFQYRKLFALSCYALTPVTMIQAINLSIPEFAFNMNLAIAAGLTTTYLAYGMFLAYPDAKK